MFYKIEMTETVVRGMTVYVEADSEEEAKLEARDEACWLEEVEGDDHETVSREVDSVQPLTAAEMDTVGFLSQCLECGAYSTLIGESTTAPGCDCWTKDDGADASPPKLPNDISGGNHGQ